MPVAPYTWQPQDYLTASHMNSELYVTGGAEFAANGIGFHAAKPVYKANIYQGGQATGGWVANAWQYMGKTATNYDESWVVQADTGGLYGARLDTFNDGCILGSRLTNGGGKAGVFAGLGLMFTYASVSAGSGRLGAGIGVNGGTTVDVQGTFQATTTQNSTAWAMDIIDLATGPNTGFLWTSIASPTSAVSNQDGSGSTCRIGAQWASVYPANGATVGSLPGPQATWTSSSPFSAALMNGPAGIAQLMTMLNNPPLLKVVSTGTTSVANGGGTAIGFPAAIYDTYSGWNSGTNTYTVPLSGLYLLYSCVPWASQSNIAATGFQFNSAGNIYYGPRMPAVGNSIGTAKVQVFSLNAGDTVQVIGYQNSGGALNAQAGSVFLAMYLGQAGAPGILPALPDVTYRWKAGTPQSAIPGLLNSHLANDLLFLAQKPYFLGYQGTSQTGIAMSTPVSVTQDTVGGIVHGDPGDPWSGWSAANNWYTAPRNGWYLVVQETFMAQATVNGGVNIACFKGSQPGSGTVDQYQAAFSSSSFGDAGAAGLNYYYLRAGDTISPYLNTIGTSAGTTATLAAAGSNSHFEAVWIGE